MRKKLIRYCSLLLLIIVTINCQKKGLTPREGFAQVSGGKVWYKIVGEGNQTPIILLHGGPGVPSYYLNPLAGLGKDRPVIFYDQLGCGRSQQEMDTALMTVESFVDQLEDLRVALGVEDFYLYGSSWGTMLGMDYYLKYPQKVKAIIFSSPCLSTKRWTADADTLIQTLPDSIQLAIRTNSKNGTYDSPDYIEASGVYAKNFVVRTPTPDVDSSFARANFTVYNYMWGPSEFTALGTLKDYDRTDRLGEIKVPTLFIAGEFDEARPTTVKFYQSLVPESSFELTKNAGHITMQENPQQDITTIRNFLIGVEQRHN
jgi:proline iminopeptidase